MAVLHDYVCFAHGEFESRTGKCPHGCGEGMTKVLFKKSPGISTSGKTQFIDKKMNDLARQFGDTAMNDKYDSSRIDMTKTDDIMKKRLRGETYGYASEAVMTGEGVIKDPSKVASVIGEVGTSSDNNLAALIGHQSGMNAIKNASIAHDDHAALPSQ